MVEMGDSIAADEIQSPDPPLRPRKQDYLADVLTSIAPDARELGSARAPSMRELAAMITMIIAADLTLYQGGGELGAWGAFALATPIILAAGFSVRRWSASAIITGLMLAVVGLRLLWLGSAPAILMALTLTGTFAMAHSGLSPFVAEFFGFMVQAFFSGIVSGARSLMGLRPRRFGRDAALFTAVPILVLCAFAFIFVMANPVLRELMASWEKQVGAWLTDFPIGADRVLLWAVVFFASAGLLSPIVGGGLRKLVTSFVERYESESTEPAPRAIYLAAFNTLIAVTALFAAYLVFEFYYLWFREFPKGFYYSGYAHEGAAWLTFALAVTTAILGAIFNGDLACDPRAGKLRRLALVWSAENFLLAVSVFHRTQIYVDYNGMSRMRVVALIGIGTVVAGFALAVWMVARRNNAVWLIRRQLWALAVAIFILLVAPVDLWVTRHNVRRILQGELAPSVQIAVQPLDTSGVGALIPLLECDEPVIRGGVAAILAQEHQRLRSQGLYAKDRHWSKTQWAESRTAALLEEHRETWERESNFPNWGASHSRFVDFARKWYD